MPEDYFQKFNTERRQSNLPPSFIRKDEDERGFPPEGGNDAYIEVQKEIMKETVAEIDELLKKLKSENNSVREIIFLEYPSASQFTIFKENGSNAMITLGIESILLELPGESEQKFFYKDRDAVKMKLESFCG